MYEPRDEISLRDLYLIFRGGFWWIVGSALLVGLAAFGYLSARPSVFEASATSQINVPVATSATEEAAWLLPPVGIGMSAYTALANRPDVLGKALGIDSTNTALLRQRVGSLSLTAIDTAAQARGQLTVAHRATATSPEEAAKIANAWADASVAAATAAMQRAAGTNAEASSRELAQRETELAAAREAWTEFARHDNRAMLTTQVTVQQQLQRDALLRIAELDNLLVTTRAKRDLVQAVLDSRNGASNLPLEAQLNALVASGALDAETAHQLESSLRQLPASVSGAGQDLMLLVSRTQLESLTADLAGYVAEKDLLERRLQDSETQMAAIRANLASITQSADQLLSALQRAQASYDNVARLAPLINLQQGMIGNAARVVVEAVAPIEPRPKNRLTITVAAALVAGLLATLAVFLRAAVREPETAPGAQRVGAATSQAAPATGER